MGTKQDNSVRIIGGALKGRRLPVLDVKDLRPTPDRVRETIFDWLNQDLAGQTVLDLFAGSGVLGFEALSRGAAAVTLVEKDPRNAKSLMSIAHELDPKRLKVINDDAIAYLKRTEDKFDLIFLDPPYHQDLLPKALEALLVHNHLKDSTLLYVEMSSGNSVAVPGYETLREQTAGQAKYALWKKSSLLF